MEWCHKLLWNINMQTKQIWTGWLSVLYFVSNCGTFHKPFTLKGLLPALISKSNHFTYNAHDVFLDTWK